AGANRLLGDLREVRFRVVVIDAGRADFEAGQQVREDRDRLVGLNLNRVLIDRGRADIANLGRDRLDDRLLTERATICTLEAEDGCLGIDWIAVVERSALDELELPRLLVNSFP